MLRPLAIVDARPRAFEVEGNAGRQWSTIEECRHDHRGHRHRERSDVRGGLEESGVAEVWRLGQQGGSKGIGIALVTLDATDARGPCRACPARLPCASNERSDGDVAARISDR